MGRPNLTMQKPSKRPAYMVIGDARSISPRVVWTSIPLSARTGKAGRMARTRAGLCRSGIVVSRDEHFLPINADPLRGFNAEPDTTAMDVHHGDPDVAVDDDRLVQLAAQYQHVD